MLKGLSILLKQDVSAFLKVEEGVLIDEKELIKTSELKDKIKDYLNSEELSFFQKEIYNGLWICQVRSRSGFVMLGSRNKTELDSLLSVVNKISV